MKKRKREIGGGGGGGGFHGLLRATLRHSCRFRGPLGGLLPLISAASGCLLFLLALLSLLSPSPSSQQLRQHRHQQQLLLRNRGSASSDRAGGGLEEESPAAGGGVFRVPSSGGSLSSDLWTSRLSSCFYGCSNASGKFTTAEKKTQPNRYLLIATSGGLNQQRTGITDAVVAAYILNATLVVPKLDQKSFWKDSSNFSEIFDVDWFISSLSKDVEIIKQIPEKGGKALNPYTMRVPRKCNPKCYQSRVLPVLNKKHNIYLHIAGELVHEKKSLQSMHLKVHVWEKDLLTIRGAVQLTKFDYRLSNRLAKDLQKLRCRVNYHSLKFTAPIVEMGRTLVERMRSKSSHFIALHLRFEPDMLAFSGCDYGGGEKERRELGAIRKRWKTLHASNPDKVRRHGRCPLTPEEVGLMLRALGFGSDVHIYVASGEVYGGNETLAPLKVLFPNFHSKETIASKEELAPFSSFSSRMAALDFIVCDESNVFVTNNNGNMAKILAGRRRYFGHKPTIRPNAKKLYKLFLNRSSIPWEEFASRVRTHQIGFMGEPNEVRPGRGEFHENPSSCICEKPEAKDRALIDAPRRINDSSEDDKENSMGKMSTYDTMEEQKPEDEQDGPDMDYMEDGNESQGKRLPNGSDSETNLLKIEQPELEEMFSD